MARQFGDSAMRAGTSPGDPRTFPREVYALRRARDAIFPRLFGDPAWDVMLHLYECHRSGWPATRDAAGGAACSSAAVGARFVAALVHEGMVRPALGTEETHVELSEEGLEMMERWVAQAHAAIARWVNSG